MPAVKYLITTRSPNLASPSVMLASKIGTFTIRTKITPEKKKKKHDQRIFKHWHHLDRKETKTKENKRKAWTYPWFPETASISEFVSEITDFLQKGATRWLHTEHKFKKMKREVFIRREKEDFTMGVDGLCRWTQHEGSKRIKNSSLVQSSNQESGPNEKNSQIGNC